MKTFVNGTLVYDNDGDRVNSLHRGQALIFDR